MFRFETHNLGTENQLRRIKWARGEHLPVLANDKTNKLLWLENGESNQSNGEYDFNEKRELKKREFWN